MLQLNEHRAERYMPEKKFEVNALVRKDNRNEMNKSGISEDGFDKNPFHLFEKWLHDALQKDPLFANAMVLSTIGENNVPDKQGSIVTKR